MSDASRVSGSEFGITRILKPLKLTFRPIGIADYETNCDLSRFL